ncbi:serine hydrolase [Nonomuraea thailandensis]
MLISRVTGRALPDLLAERVFEPLGMVDTAFEVPAAKRDRFTSYYRTGPELADGPDGQWSTPPAFPWPVPGSWAPPTTGSPSAACCSPEASRTAGGGSCRRSRCDR